MRRYSSQLCPRYQQAIQTLGKRWTGLILSLLLRGPRRFSQLRLELEVVSDRVLSQRLKELERQGILKRRVLRKPLVVVQYALTSKGKALGEVVTSVERWAEEWIAPTPRRARSA